PSGVPPQDGLVRDTVILAVMSLASGQVSEVGTYPNEENVVSLRRGGLHIGRAPFARETHTAAGAGLYAIGVSDVDGNRVYDRGGKQRGFIGGVRIPMAVTAGAARKYYRALSGPRSDLARIFRRVGHPDAAPPMMPAFDALKLDPEENVWVRRYAPPWVGDS